MAHEQQLVAFVSLKLNGKDAPLDVMGDLMEVVVDESLHLPTMFSLRLHNPGMRWLDSEVLREGIEVEVGVPVRANATPQSICRGRIAAIEPELSEQMPAVTFRGYDLGVALFRGRRSRSYVEMTDADIVKRVAQEAGLEAQAEDNGPPHEYVLQANQSDMDFLRDRAQRISYEVFLDGRVVHFRSPPAAKHAVELKWGINLKTFTPRLSTAAPVDEVVVRSWDPRRKQEIVGRATQGDAAPRIGEKRFAGEVAHQAWDRAAKMVVVDRPVRTQREADDLARALMEERVGSFVEAEGTCNGDPELRAGKTVRITGLGQRFEGQYYLTAVTHVFRSDRGHQTTFHISGRRAGAGQRALAGDLGRSAARYHGVAVGVVTNNKDDEGLGRVKVRLPWLGDDAESDWARIAAPMAGGGRGFYYLPEVNDEVLVAFEHGDVHRPYVLGSLWNGKDRPPKPNRDVVASDGKVKRRILRTTSGHVVTFDDSAESPSITVEDKTGTNKIVIDSLKNEVRIEASGMAKITATQGVTIDGADIKLGQTAALSLANEVFVELFNAHVHTAAGFGSPTSPPIVPAVKGVATTVITKGA